MCSSRRSGSGRWLRQRPAFHEKVMLWLRRQGRIIRRAHQRWCGRRSRRRGIGRVDQDVERRKCSPDLQGKIWFPIPIEVTGNEVAAGGTGVGGCGIVQHERLEGAIAVAFQDLYHALEPPSQTEGKVLASIAVVVRDRLVMRDADIRFGDDVRARETCRRRCRSGSRY